MPVTGSDTPLTCQDYVNPIPGGPGLFRVPAHYRDVVVVYRQHLYHPHVLEVLHLLQLVCAIGCEALLQGFYYRAATSLCCACCTVILQQVLVTV